jgi:hypothetical protein
LFIAGCQAAGADGGEKDKSEDAYTLAGNDAARFLGILECFLDEELEFTFSVIDFLAKVAFQIVLLDNADELLL